MKLRSTVTVACLALGLMPVAAEAAPVVYDFSFAETGIANQPGTGSFSGEFTVDNMMIIAVSGSGASIGKINGILPIGDYQNNDNFFSDASPYLDFNGVSFSTAIKGDLNLFFDTSSNYTALTNNGGSDGTLTVSLSSINVPLPASAPMFSAAVIALGAVGYGLKRKNATVV